MKNKNKFHWSLFNITIVITQLVFLILKLTDVVDWSWGIVFIPIIFDAIWGIMILDLVYYINKFVIAGITLRADNLNIALDNDEKAMLEKIVNNEIDNADVNVYTEDATVAE